MTAVHGNRIDQLLQLVPTRHEMTVWINGSRIDTDIRAVHVQQNVGLFDLEVYRNDAAIKALAATYNRNIIFMCRTNVIRPSGIEAGPMVGCLALGLPDYEHVMKNDQPWFTIRFVQRSSVQMFAEECPMEDALGEMLRTHKIECPWLELHSEGVAYLIAGTQEQGNGHHG